MDFTPLNVTLAILGISLLVIVHEAGHYFAARAFGMRVLRFSIGLGPAIWKRKAKDSPTTFQVCAIPLLAYVQIDGMNPTETVDPDDEGLYPNKGVFARIVTIFAGPLANYVCASVLVFILALTGGLPDARVTNRVDAVVDGTPAAGEGECPEGASCLALEAGDVVVEVNGTAVDDGESLIEANSGRAGEPTSYVFLRDGERIETTLTPAVGDNGRPQIGIRLAGERIWTVAPDAKTAARRALEVPVITTVLTLREIGRLIRERDAEDVQSVVGMTSILAESLEDSPQLYVSYVIQLSIALGLFNLLPFPALDGGRLAFLGYEVITRRRANEKVEAVIHTVGLLFLLVVLAVVMGRDIWRLI